MFVPPGNKICGLKTKTIGKLLHSIDHTCLSNFLNHSFHVCVRAVDHGLHHEGLILSIVT
jgi:hypothetical protein